jgi:hypothetical protein
VAQPTVEIAEGASNRISISQSGFYLFPDQLNLRFDSAGATSCYADVMRNGYFQGRYYFGASANIGAYGGTQYGGNFTWAVTCTSAQGQQTTATASGTLRRRISLDWSAATTSTGGYWQTLPNGAIVSWSVSANAPFDQSYTSTNADYCWVQSFGFIGNPYGDIQNPNFNYYQSFQQTFLWDSGMYFPRAYLFATFNFRDPHNSPYGIAPFDGYKWLLQCWNYDGDWKSKVMYGVAQP